MKSAHLDQARELHASGNLRAAVDHYREHLKSHPDNAECWHTVGTLRYQLGDIEAAGKCMRRAADLAPGNADYCNDCGVIALVEKRWQVAETYFRRAIELRPDQVQFHNNLGHALTGAGQTESAINCFRAITRNHPAFVDAHFNLGKLLQQTGLLELALQAYESAIQLQPTLAVAHFQLGQVFSLLDRKEAAVRCFRRTLELAPHFIEAKLALSDVLTETYRAAEAVEMLQSIAHSGQESLKAMLHLGRAHEVLGDLAKAETTYREALRIWPNAAEPWIGLSSCKRFKAEDRADVEQLETLLRSNQFDQSTLSALHFALGKMLDDCRRYDDAFRHYQIGNDLRRELTKSEPVDFGTLTEATIAFFTPEYFASKSHVGNDTTLPIFVVGMPRSGTSLVEQIISSHPKAHGAGELYYIPQVAHGLHVLLKTNAQFPSICTQLDSENAKQIIEPYLALLRWHSPTAERVVDKMPTNFRYLGLIATLFPNARIIHCERDPMDTCLSIYFHRFARGHEYSFELQAIGHHYRNHYQRLMTHWNSALPDRIYTCNYEQLIADPETQARKLIAACGLPWDDACLAFHATKRQVRTASIAQVREGIYTRSKERWRNYEKYLGPLKEALGLNH